jgi:hypothetical protein
MYRTLSHDESSHLAAANDLWERQLPVLQLQRAISGGMQWKEAKGREYLIRHWNDRAAHKKKSTSLGVRSPDTERQFEEFQAKRERFLSSAAIIMPTLERFARISKTCRLPRLPAAETDIFRALGAHHLDRELLVFSGEALHVYGAILGLGFNDLEPADGEMTLYMTSPGLDVVQDGLVDVIAGAARGVEFDDGRFVLDRAAGRLTIVTYATEELFSVLRKRAGNDADREEVIWEALQDEPRWAAVMGDDGLPVPMAAVPPKAFLLLALALGRISADGSRDLAEAFAPEITFYERDVEAFPELEGLEEVGGPKA